MRTSSVSFKYDYVLDDEALLSTIEKWFFDRFARNMIDYAVTTCVVIIKGGSMFDRKVVPHVMISNDELAMEFKLTFADRMNDR